MNTYKITVLLIVLFALFFQAMPVQADELSFNHPVESGSKANSHVAAKHEIHSDTLTPRSMQDITQCKLTNNGVLVCVDVCGGLSVPGTVCSFK